MITRPFDLNVTAEEMTQAYLWWRSLSINEMKALEAKHFPGRNWFYMGPRYHHQMWEEEGKPLPAKGASADG